MQSDTFFCSVLLNEINFHLALIYSHAPQSSMRIYFTSIYKCEKTHLVKFICDGIKLLRCDLPPSPKLWRTP